MEQCHKHARVPRPRNMVVRLRSSVPGRMRWEAEALRGHPRKAAAVEMTLQQMAGVHSVEATPLTGRLLVRYDADLSPQEMTAMVHTALCTPALSPEAYAALNGSSNGQRHIGVPLHPGHTNGHTHDHEVDDTSVRGHIRRLFLGGSVLFGLLVKRLVTGSRATGSSPSSVGDYRHHHASVRPALLARRCQLHDEGRWRDNRYPGELCHRGEPDLARECDWAHRHLVTEPWRVFASTDAAPYQASHSRPPQHG